MKKIAVILSGNGVYDGAEIHESVLTLLAISKNNASYQCFAPNIEHTHIINHLTGEEEPNEKRNVLVEAARIARGDIKDLSSYNALDYDALILPGGFGVAKNLSSFAFDDKEYQVNEQVEKVVADTYKQKKPIGAWCIAPTIISKVLGEVKLTIGSEEATAERLKKNGSEHINTGAEDIVIDHLNKIVTTPCYMLDSSILEVFNGIEKAVKSVMNLIE